MSVNIPSIEDKIYNLFGDILREDWMTDEDLKEIVDESMKLSGMNMETFIQLVVVGVEAGYTIEEQFEIFKKLYEK